MELEGAAALCRTNCNHAALEIWRGYNGRAGVECRIEESAYRGQSQRHYRFEHLDRQSPCGESSATFSMQNGSLVDPGSMKPLPMLFRPASGKRAPDV
jgi:hypothetical protein